MTTTEPRQAPAKPDDPLVMLLLAGLSQQHLEDLAYEADLWIRTGWGNDELAMFAAALDRACRFDPER